MYIFGESELSTGAKAKPSPDSRNIFEELSYYNRSYAHLLAYSERTPAVRKLVSRKERDIIELLASSTKPLLEHYSKGELADDPELPFIIGRLSLEFLEGPGSASLDPSARRLLDAQFRAHGKLVLRTSTVRHLSWYDLTGLIGSGDFSKGSTTPNHLPLSISYFEPDTSRNRTLKGKLEIKKDMWGNYPIRFLPNRRGYQNSSRGKEEVAKLNGILQDHRRRRSGAMEYLAIRDSRIMPERTFRKAMECLMPFIPRGFDHDPEVFEALRGGRVPDDARLKFHAISDGNYLELKVLRCSACRVPAALKLVLRMIAHKVDIDYVAEIVPAIAEATKILGDSHGAFCYHSI